MSLFNDLPTSIPELVKLVQGVTIHVFWTERYGFFSSKRTRFLGIPGSVRTSRKDSDVPDRRQLWAVTIANASVVATSHQWRRSRNR